MSINMTRPLAIGNAVRLWLAPPSTAKKWRVLRNTTGVFVDENDPAATVVYEGTDDSLVDDTGLLNATAYSYVAFYFDGAVWTASTVVSVTPAATYGEDSTDVLSVVRDRLAAGVKVEVSRGALIPKTGKIHVLNAPPQAEEEALPVLSVHLDMDSSSERHVGGEVLGDILVDAGIESGEGWLSRWQLTIVGWSLNPDERIALRKAIKRILIANMEVFDAQGMVQIDVNFKDAEDFGTFNAPIYQTFCTFTCIAPSRTTETFTPISDTDVTVTAVDPVLVGSI